jgi:hypothetical protein
LENKKPLHLAWSNGFFMPFGDLVIWCFGDLVMKKEFYVAFKREYMDDKIRRETLIKMVAKLQSEFDASIRAEAKAIIEKEQKTRMDSSISPVDAFLKKNNNPKTSTERAAAIFKNDNNIETKPP